MKHKKLRKPTAAMAPTLQGGARASVVAGGGGGDCGASREESREGGRGRRGGGGLAGGGAGGRLDEYDSGGSGLAIHVGAGAGGLGGGLGGSGAVLGGGLHSGGGDVSPRERDGPSGLTGLPAGLSGLPGGFGSLALDEGGAGAGLGAGLHAGGGGPRAPPLPERRGQSRGSDVSSVRGLETGSVRNESGYGLGLESDSQLSTGTEREGRSGRGGHGGDDVGGGRERTPLLPDLNRPLTPRAKVCAKACRAARALAARGRVAGSRPALRG